jgi:hypothetical protein
LLLLLAHPLGDIVGAAAGALVNLSADPAWRLAHTSGGGRGSVPGGAAGAAKMSPFPPLLAVLRRSALKDLALSSLVCQVRRALLHPFLGPLSSFSAFSPTFSPPGRPLW